MQARLDTSHRRGDSAGRSPGGETSGARPADANQQPRLLDQVRTRLRVLHRSRRTEEAYVGWIRRYILFHGKRHPSAMGAAEIQAFLNDLATRLNVAASTQNQALCALVFLYRQVLGQEAPQLGELVHARRPQMLPSVLTPEEVRRVLAQLEGVPRLVASLCYGSGLRLLEALQLRVKDLDFVRREIVRSWCAMGKVRRIG